MTQANATLWAITLCMLVAAGCTTIAPGLGLGAEPRYVELTEEQPADIAVPDGFQMVTRTKESYAVDLGTDGFRQAHLVYEGATSPRRVARFLEKTMVLPSYGWRDRSEYQNEGDRTLKFIKGRTVCTVVISEVVREEDTRTRIEIDIVSRA